MAQTTTLFAHGATRVRDARLRSPCSSTAARYFISPAWPAAIHSGKCLSSGASDAGAMPARSKPASSAARLTMTFTLSMELANAHPLCLLLLKGISFNDAESRSHLADAYSGCAAGSDRSAKNWLSCSGIRSFGIGRLSRRSRSRRGGSQFTSRCSSDRRRYEWQPFGRTFGSVETGGDRRQAAGAVCAEPHQH